LRFGDPLNRSGESQTYSYWLRWRPPGYEKELARVLETRSGLTLDHARRLFIIDFAAPEIDSFNDVQPQVFASQGALKNISGQRNELTGGYRVSFELDVSGVDLAELRLFLLGDEIISETWLYRWTH
jgi:glucans biosynthesis protein